MSVMGRVLKIIKYFLITVLTLLALICMWVFVQTLTKPNEVPSIFGYKPFIVLSGSMETELYRGDLAIVKEVDVNSLKENDIIAFKDKDNYVVTHRIVKIEKDKFITKGDNNNKEDSDPVSKSKIEGLCVYKISGLGSVLLVLQKPITLVIIIGIIIMVGIVWITFDSNKLSIEERKELEQLRKEKNKKTKKV